MVHSNFVDVFLMIFQLLDEFRGFWMDLIQNSTLFWCVLPMCLCCFVQIWWFSEESAILNTFCWCFLYGKLSICFLELFQNGNYDFFCFSKLCILECILMISFEAIRQSTLRNLCHLQCIFCIFVFFQKTVISVTLGR